MPNNPREFTEDDLALISTGGSKPGPGIRRAGRIQVGTAKRDDMMSAEQIRTYVAGGSFSQKTTSMGDNILGGLARGAQNDPIVGALFDGLVSAFPDTTEQEIASLVQRTQNSTLADVFAVIGEYGPSFAIGGAAYGVGRSLAVKGLARLGAGQGIESTLGKIAARQLTSAQQAAKFGKAAESLKVMPVMERGAMAVGGSAGIGAFVGAEELVDGAPVGDAAKSALVGAALAGVFEGALIGATSLPIIGLKSPVDASKINAVFESKILPLLAKEKDKLRTKADKITHQINELLGVNGQQRELFTARMLQGKSSIVPGEGGLTRSGKQALDPILAAKNKGRALKVVRGRLKAIEQLEESPVGSYLRDEPYNPKGFFETLAKFRIRTFQTPESMRGQLGRTMNKFIEMVDSAETHVKIAQDLNKKILGEMQQGLGKALGFSRRTKDDGRSFWRVFNAWEKFGEQGVRNFMANEGRGKFADEAVSMFKSYDEGMMTAYGKLVKLGAERTLSPADLQKLGVAKYIPHVLDDIPEEQAVKQMAKVMGERRAQQMFNQQNRRGLSKFGSIDFQRSMKGSLAEKTRMVADKTKARLIAEGREVKYEPRGMPFNTNPFDASFQYLNAVHRRIQYGQRFGFSGEIQDTIIKAAVKEGANRSITHSLVDLALGHRYYDQSLQQFSRTVTGLQTGSKLGLAVLPNMSQTINTLVFGGLRNLTRGLLTATKGENRSEILQSVALMESLVEGMGRTFGKTHLLGTDAVGTGFTRSASLMDGFAHATLKWSGFSQVEKWNRVIAGATGYHVIGDTVKKNIAGRLRGGNLDAARRRMQSLGIDLDDVTKIYMREGKDSAAFKDIVSAGMFKASTITQFNPNILRKPLLWNHPVGKVMAQFKTFALGQGRFIRDQIFAEAKQGNMKPMAYFLSVYPVAGEVVAQSKSFVRLKDRKVANITGDDAIDRVIQDYTMVGGLGLLSDMWTSARFGKPLEGVLGPTISDAADLTASLAQGQPGQLLDMVLRTPTAKAITFAGAATVMGGGAMADWSAEAISEYLRALDEDKQDETKTIVDIGVLRTTR